MNTKEAIFWEWFSKNENTYYLGVEGLETDNKLFDQLSNELEKIHEDLTFEFGPKEDNKPREFMISAEGIKELFPFVINLVEQAPKLEKWEIKAFRQRAEGTDLVIQYKDIRISYSDLFFRYAIEENELGIELNIRNFVEEDSFQNAIYILLDGLLGEYDVTMGISWIEWVKLDENKTNSLYPITHLRTLIDERKNKQ